jgi:hypothetical protein
MFNIKTMRNCSYFNSDVNGSWMKAWPMLDDRRCHAWQEAALVSREPSFDDKS